MDTAKFFDAIIRAFKLAFQIFKDQFLKLDELAAAFGALKGGETTTNA